MKTSTPPKTILRDGDSFDLSGGSRIMNAAGKRIAEDVEDYIKYYELAKHQPPEIVRVSRKLLGSAGWNAAAKKEGKRADPNTLKLSYKGIPVEAM